MLGGRQLEGGGCKLAQLGKANDVYPRRGRQRAWNSASSPLNFASQQVKWNALFCQLGKDSNAHQPAMTVHYPNNHPDEKDLLRNKKNAARNIITSYQCRLTMLISHQTSWKRRSWPWQLPARPSCQTHRPSSTQQPWCPVRRPQHPLHMPWPEPLPFEARLEILRPIFICG